MKISQITAFLENWAPSPLQESYDNSGLIFGNPEAEIEKCLISLDCTEAVVDEAIAKKCNLIISHHPIVFSGLKSLTGKNYVERTVIKAIQNNIAIYAIHTNLDSVQTGVNQKVGEKLGVQNPKILAPKKGLLQKLVVFVPKDYLEAVRDTLFEAGAGHIGEYDECSYQNAGEGTFRPSENTDPHVGEKNQRHTEPETRLEVIIESFRAAHIIRKMIAAHPYEEVAYDLYNLENVHPQIGSGMVGYLSEPMYVMDFLQKIKNEFGGVVRHTDLVKDQIAKVAWCGGSGSFLIEDAKRAGADLFLTSDVKYHQFFDAENQMIIADIGHFENERCAIELVGEKLMENFPNFAVLFTETNTNPIHYL